MRQVLLIVGPPGAGKSTYAATSGLLHLEREQFRSDDEFRIAAITAAGELDAQVAVVRTCPTLDEQALWQELINPTKIVVLDVSAKECARRIRERHRSNWRGETAAARSWHLTRRQPETVDEHARVYSRAW